MRAIIEKTCAYTVSVLLLMFPIYFAMILSSAAYAQESEPPSNRVKVEKAAKDSGDKEVKVANTVQPPGSPPRQDKKEISDFIKIGKDGIQIKSSSDGRSKVYQKADSLEDIVVPTVLFLMILGIVVGIYYYDHKNKKAYFETVKHIVDQGQPVPASLLEGSYGKKKKTWIEELRTGLILCGLGVGFAIFFKTMPGNGPWAMGLILLFMGVAKVIAAVVRKKYEINS